MDGAAALRGSFSLSRPVKVAIPKWMNIPYRSACHCLRGESGWAVANSRLLGSLPPETTLAAGALSFSMR